MGWLTVCVTRARASQNLLIWMILFSAQTSARRVHALLGRFLVRGYDDLQNAYLTQSNLHKATRHIYYNEHVLEELLFRNLRIS